MISDYLVRVEEMGGIGGGRCDVEGERDAAGREPRCYDVNSRQGKQAGRQARQTDRQTRDEKPTPFSPRLVISSQSVAPNNQIESLQSLIERELIGSMDDTVC